MAFHKPVTIDEDFLVREMVNAMWRIQRLGRFEVAVFEKAPGGNPFSDPALSAELLKLNRYEKSLESSYLRLIRELRASRKDQAAAVREAERKEAAAAKIRKAEGDARVLDELEAFLTPPRIMRKERNDIEERIAAKRTQSGPEGI